MVTPRHETPKESFQLSEGVIPAFAATDARAPRPDVKNESFAIEVVAVARDLNLARGKKVLCHIRSDPPADPPQILASERTAAKSSCTFGTLRTSDFLCNFRDLLNSSAGECRNGGDGTGGDEGVNGQRPPPVYRCLCHNPRSSPALSRSSLCHWVRTHDTAALVCDSSNVSCSSGPPPTAGMR